MARPSTGARFRLGAPIDDDLADFCAASWNASQTEVIREAVKTYIEQQLVQNEGLQERFASARRKRLETGS